MTDSPDPPTPDDAPLSVGDDEVERLLKEAESLTAEIAEDAGVDAQPGDLDAVASPPGPATPAGLDEPTPDPLTATAKAETAAKGLSDLLQDSDAAESADTPAPPPPADDAAEDEFASPPSHGQNDEFDGFSALSQDEHAAFESAVNGEADPASEASDDEEIPEDDSAEDDDSTEDDEAFPEADESEKPAPIAWIPRCVQVLKSVPSGLRSAPKSVPAAIKAVIVWTDRPFAGLSMGLKRVLGVIALASILAGIAAWVLPGALEHNQFAEMPTGTAVDRPVLQPTED